MRTNAAVGIGLICLGLWAPASGTEIRTYRCTLTMHVEAQFRPNVTLDQVLADFHGLYDDSPDSKEYLARVLALRGHPQCVTRDLVEKTDGRSYVLQQLGITLPDAQPVLNHELYKDQRNYKWTTYTRPTTAIGDVDAGWTNSLVWQPLISTLFGYAPVGPTYHQKGLGRNEVALAEFGYEALGISPSKAPADPQRYFVVKYTDASRRAIESIACFWNSRAKAPFTVLTFKNSRVDGLKHSFSEVTETRFDSNRVSSVTSYRLLSVSRSDEAIDATPPQGTVFVDRESPDGKHYTFSFSGSRFPTLEELKSPDSSLGLQGSSAISLAFGIAALMILGSIVWQRGKTTGCLAVAATKEKTGGGGEN